MKKKILTILLGVAVTLSFTGVTPAMANSYQEQIDQAQKQINQAREQVDQAKDEQRKKQQGISQDKKKVEKVQNQEEALKKEIDQLDEQISDVEEKINAKQSSISETKSQIQKLKDQIKETEKRIKKRDQLLKTRVRAMYENGGAVNYLDVVLGSKSFSDFLDRLMALNLITQQDKQLLQEQKKDKALLEQDQKEVENQLSHLEKQLSDLKDLKLSLDQKEQKKKEVVGQLKAQEEQLQKQIASGEKSLKQLKSQISDTIKEKVAAIKKKEEATAAKKEQEQRRRQSERQKGGTVHSTSVSVRGTGVFTKPVKGSYHISSGYGPRWGGFHDGIDFGALCGTPIVAVASGEVLLAGSASGFGNWIVIYHPQVDLVTIYGHMYNDGYFVHSGQRVSQGQEIGVVGSNGESTGCHVHFEVDHPEDFSWDHGINPNPYF